MKHFITELLKDKGGNYSLRELAIALLLIALIISWIAAQFFNRPLPEFIFYGFASLVAAGCFGYSFERGQPEQQNPSN